MTKFNHSLRRALGENTKRGGNLNPLTPMIIQISYDLLTFDFKPNVIGLIVRGMRPPADDAGLINFVKECAKNFTKEMTDALVKNPSIKIVRNNDTERPSDELFLQYEFPFHIGARCALFKEGAHRFICGLYKLESLDEPRSGCMQSDGYFTYYMDCSLPVITGVEVSAN